MERPTKLFNRHFVLLWQGQFVSMIGTQLHGIAMMFWVKHATGSASLMGSIMMISMLPSVILGPLGGTFADRYSRRNILVVCDALRGVAVLCLAAMLFLMPTQTNAIIVWIFAIAVLAGILGAVFRPAVTAAIPDLVPRDKVPAANALNQSMVQGSVFLGQGMGGVLFRLLGAPMLFFIDGLTYLFSAVSECFIRIPQVLPESSKTLRGILAEFRRDTHEGLLYVWRHRGMRSLFFASAFLNFFISPIGVLLPFYVEDHLHTTADWFGFFLAALGAGSLIGYALAGVLKMSGKTRGVLLITFLILIGLCFASLGLVPPPFVSLAIFLTCGVLLGVCNITIMTTLQLTTQSEIRGRVFGLLGTLSTGLVPIGMGLAGVVADLVNQDIPLIMAVSGLATSALTVVVAFDRHFREFLSYVPEVEPDQPSPE